MGQKTSESGKSPATENGAIKVIAVDHELGDKVSRNGPDREAVCAAANTAAAALHTEYRHNLGEDLQTVETRMGKAVATPDQRAEHISALFLLVHNIRGEAGTVGMPEMSKVADLLCKIVEQCDMLDETALEGVMVHVNAMRLIYDSYEAGGKSAAALNTAEMISGLQAVAAKLTGRSYA